MKLQHIIFYTFSLLMLGACVLREADPVQKEEVFLFTNELTDTDSTLIQEFEKKTKCHVRIQFMKPDEYLKKVSSNVYNTGADVLWFSNDSVRDKLYQKGYLNKIDNENWDQLESEFSVKHKLWFPICHDPLVVTKPKDSLNDCRSINFNTWHKKDSLSPKFIYPTVLKTYSYSLMNNELSSILISTKYRKFSNETVWQLSALAKKQMVADSNFHQEKYFCKNLISFRKKHITIISCLFIPRYARNSHNAKLLINWLTDRHKQIASARNQLSCIKNTEASYIIRNMSLNF